MGIIAWIVIGFIAGLIAKAIMPGKDPGGAVITTLIGIGGGVLGGWIGQLLFNKGTTGFSFWSLILSVLGAVLLLYIYRLATGSKHRPTHAA